VNYLVPEASVLFGIDLEARGKYLLFGGCVFVVAAALRKSSGDTVPLKVTLLENMLYTQIPTKKLK
jgi:hypothetical protein